MAANIRTAALGGTGSVASFIPTYWDQVLGQNLYPNLYLYGFGVKRQVPRNFGLTIKIPRKKRQNVVGQLQSASEGLAVSTNLISSQFISGTLKQFAGAYRFSDIVIMTALTDVLELSLRDIARDIALKMDDHIQDSLSAGGQVLTPSEGGTIAGHGPGSTLRATTLLKGSTILEAQNNPRPPDGYFPTVLHPYSAFGLQLAISNNAWHETNKFASDNTVQQIYRSELGRLFGCKMTTSTNSARRYLGTAPGASAGASTARNWIFAPDSYYVTEISDMTAKTFVKQLGSAGALDPVNQVATVGAKVFFTAIPANWGSEVRYIKLYAGARTPL